VRRNVVVVALIAAGAAVGAAEEPPAPPVPRHYIAYRAPGSIQVDGALDEPAWAEAAWSEAFVDIEGAMRPAPTWNTRMKMLWDHRFLYIAAQMEEPHVWATLTERDSVIFHDNDFEVFLDPGGDTLNYYELEINALGTVWDLLLMKPYRDGGPSVNEWDIDGLRSAIAVQGTRNDPSDRDTGWTVELALPWKILAEHAPGKRRPRDGDLWRINFSRVEWDVEVEDGSYRKRADPSTGKPLPEHNWVWSPQGVIDMHQPEMWGVVQFSKVKAGRGRVAARPLDHREAGWTLPASGAGGGSE
jgi:hypothetical protein